jgi:hypothetical protein
VNQPDAPPDDVVALADARADARMRREYATADRLKGEIEAAGWRIVDAGASYRLAPAHPPDLVVGGATLHGSSATVPSRLDEPDSHAATVVIVMDGPDPSGPEAALRSLRQRDSAGPSVEVVVVVAAPDPETDAVLRSWTAGPSPTVEVVRTAAPLSTSGALNAAMRRATGTVIVWLSDGWDAAPWLVDRAIEALADPDVAVAGPTGRVSADLLEWAPGSANPAAIDGQVLAFRRADLRTRGFLDERLGSGPLLDAWWSLVLRDDGPDRPARRAAVFGWGGGLPPPDPGAPSGPGDSDPQARRRRKRNAYRILDRFRDRPDLVSREA